MVQRNMSDNFFRQEKSEEDITIIISSLRKAKAKYKDNTLAVSKTDLIYKIVDNLAVSKDLAVKYLMILKSRGIITIDKDIVYFSPREDEEATQQAEKEVDEAVKK